MIGARRSWLAWGIVVALVPALTFAAGEQGRKRLGQYDPTSQSVEMFEGIENDQIKVTLIQKDSSQCRIMIENKTNRPLNVKLPKAFAGVPVLAQVGGRGGSGSSSNQTTGGGTGGFGMGGGGGGGGMFNVPAEKVGSLKATTVCLEHGKNEPRPQMKYEIKPLSAFTDKPEIHQLCEMLGTGKLNQRAAQVAAWHLSDDMSWQELASKRLRFANGTSRPYFSQHEMQAGMKIVAIAAKLAKKNAPKKIDSMLSQ